MNREKVYGLFVTSGQYVILVLTRSESLQGAKVEGQSFCPQAERAGPREQLLSTVLYKQHSQLKFHEP